MTTRKIMVRLAYSVALAVFALEAALLFFENRRLRSQVKHMEEGRNQAVITEYTHIVSNGTKRNSTRRTMRN